MIGQPTDAPTRPLVVLMATCASLPVGAYPVTGTIVADTSVTGDVSRFQTNAVKSADSPGATSTDAPSTMA